MVVAEKIHHNLMEPFYIEGHAIKISTSIGIAIYPEHGSTESELLNNADSAMYFSKQCGRNTIQIYNSEIPKIGRGNEGLSTNVFFDDVN